MKKFLLGIILLLSTTCPLFGQSTTGFHRVAVALARAFQGVNAQVIPNAKVTVTATATGLAATIYSDPLLSSQITPSVVTADNSGNYGYYIALNYCVTETITSPGQGTQVIPNICNLGGGAVASVQGTSPIQVNGQSGVPEVGAVTVSCANNCAAYGSLLMQVNPPSPPAHQYILYPTSVTGTGTSSNTVQCGGSTVGSASCSGSGALANGGYISHPYCNLNCSANNIITWTFPSLPSFINPANVTSIYGGMVGYTTTTTLVGNGTTFQFECGKTSQTTVATTQAYGTQLAFGTYTALLSGLVGTDVPSITCDAQTLALDPTQAGIFGNMPSTFLVIDYTGSAPPVNTAITVLPPLNFNPGTNSLSLAVPFDVGIDTGSANAYAATLPWINQGAGTTVKFVPVHASTSTTPTFNLNGIGAATIVGPQGGALTSGDLSTTATAVVILDNAGNWRLQDPQVSGSGGGTTTNALTMNNSGSGAASGTTFNGSAAQTISYNTIGAQQALTLTTTGSSGPATLSGGALNIPQYTGGGGGNCPAGWQCVTSTATDWGTQCAAAVTALGAGGGVIYTAPGTYTMANNCHVNQNNISLLGAGSQATVIDVTIAGDGLTYQMVGTTALTQTSNSFAGMSFIGNGASGQIPIHFKDTRGLNFTDLLVNYSGPSSPCIEFENVIAWTEENRGNISFGRNCFAAVEMFQDAEANVSFGYNNLNLFVEVGTGQYGLYIPASGTKGTMFHGQLNFFGDLSGSGVMIYNHGVDIGQSSSIYVPTMINVQTEDNPSGSPTLWDVSGVNTVFVSPIGINAVNASQGTAYSTSNNFYPTNGGPTRLTSEWFGTINNRDVFDALAPGLSNGNSVWMDIGVDTSNNFNSLSCGLSFTSSSSTSNYGYCGLPGAPNQGFRIDSNNRIILPNLANATSLATDANGKIIAGTSGGLQGTVTYTTSQTGSISDNGKLVIMNCSTACAYTLPATQPSTTWNAWVTTQGSTVATIALGGSDTFNGSLSVPVLNSFRILSVWANSATATDYRGDAPMTASSPIVLTPSSNSFNVSCPTCSVGSGTSVSVNGGAGLGTANLNDTTPAAASNGLNVKWQNSTSNVSAYVPGDGTATHFLNGTGAWSTPSGGGPSPFTVTLTGASTDQSLTSCLSSSYNDYEIEYSIVGATSTPAVGLIFNSDTTSGDYIWGANWTGIGPNTDNGGPTRFSNTYYNLSTTSTTATLGVGYQAAGAVQLQNINSTAVDKTFQNVGVLEQTGHAGGTFNYAIYGTGVWGPSVVAAVTSMSLHITGGSVNGYVTCRPKAK